MPTYIGNNEVYEKYIGGKNVMGQFIGSDAVHLNHHKENGVDSVHFKSLGYPIDQWKIVGSTVQNGTPDPTSPIPVQGVGDRTANLFDKFAQYEIGTSVYTFTISGLVPQTKYVCSTNFNNTTVQTASIYFGGGNSSTHGVWADRPKIMTADENGILLLHIRFRNIDGGIPIYDDLIAGTIWVQVERGTNPTTYEPYGYKIPISSNGTTVATLYTDNQLYGDGTNPDYLQRLADGSGVEHKAWGIYVFDGTENFSVLRTVDGRNAYRLPIDGIVASEDAAGTYSVKSTHFNSQLFANIYACVSYGIAAHNHNATSNAYICTDVVDTLEELKAYITAQYAAGTPVTVVYPLATPTDTPIPKGKSYGENLTKVDDYMYNIVYNEIDRDYAKEFIRNNYFNIAGACSSVQKGNFFGRNYDWKYDKTAYYIVNVTHEAAKYSSIGIAGGFSRMTNDFAKSGETSDLYRVLPYATLDGINENGVVANINVVPAGDKGRTTGTIPTGEHRETLCQMSLVRYVLDNFATAQDAVDDIVAHVSVYAPNVDGASELHLMIADANNTFVIEFINNQTVVRDMESYYDGRTYMTNFYLDGTTVNSDNHINFSSVTDYGSGLERYNIISDGFNNVNSVATMTELMTSLNFTNAYQSTTSPAWNTEFVSEEMGLTVRSASNDFEPIVNAAIAGFADATRNGKYWITCHTSVYDIQSKKMYLIFQENSSSTQREIAYRTYQSTISSIPAIETATRENALTVDTTVSPSALSVVVRGGDSISVMQNVFVDAHGVIFTTADGVPFGFEEV